MKRYLVTCVGLLFLAACNKSPSERTKSVGSGGTGTFGNTPAFIIFNSELGSGGGAFEYPGSAGQSLSFSDRSNPISDRSIRYSWTGEVVAGQHTFAGFDLMHTPTQATYTSTPGRDLHSAGYTRVIFYARGSLTPGTFVKIEVADDGDSNTFDASCVSLSTTAVADDTVNPCGRRDTLTSDWKQYTIPIVSPATSLTHIKDFFKATFIFIDPFGGNTVPGNGGTIYIDQIAYE